MEEKTLARVGIVASIVGAVGAVAYLLSKPSTGPSGSPGAAGAPGVGIPGPAGMPGASIAAGAPTVADVTPTPQAVNQYFVSQFYTPDGAYAAGAINSNASPMSDLSKRVSGYGNNTAFTPAPSKGCGGGCGGTGCGGGRCPNTPAPLAFGDGQGSCAATTVGRLQQTMNGCMKGNVAQSIRNMAGNSQAFTGEPDWELFRASYDQTMAAVPGPLAADTDQNLVGASRFGAS